MSNNIFHHEQIYRGEYAIQKLANYRIAICGCGALGSNLANHLARQGATSLTLIDNDRIEPHNINTQLWTTEDVGAQKVMALANHIYLAVGKPLVLFDKKLTSKNTKKFLKDVDLIVDCFDNVESRQVVRDHCRSVKIPCLHTGLLADYGEVVWDDIYHMPKDAEVGLDLCDYPMSRGIVLLTVAVASEEILNWILKTRQSKSWSITLNDLNIEEYQ